MKMDEKKTIGGKMLTELQGKILNTLSKYNRVMASRELMKKAGIKNKQNFYDSLHQLKAQGDIVIKKNHYIEKVEKEGSERKFQATIVSLSKGFAFARPLNGGEDLFIHIGGLKGAMVGDAVVLKNIKVSERGKSAEVEKIATKKKQDTTGTVVKIQGGFEIVPDSAIRYHIPLSKAEAMRAKPGDKVLVSLYRNHQRDDLQAKVTKIYGKANSAKICADAIIDQNGIPSVFPDVVLEEAVKIAQYQLTEQDLKGRLDLRDVSICTIDGEDAKDLDDAVFVSRTKNGYRLGVHIADVSHYVKEGSAMDEEAKERGTSVYFADRVIPMLPKEISNGICSLNAGEDKLTFSAIIDLDKTGKILSYQIKKSVINSKVRGVYSEVNKIFDKTADADLKKKYAPVVRSLNTAHELADILRKRSHDQGTMDLESRESKFTLDENGLCVDVQPRLSGEAEGMIEQLMITANQAAAMLAKEEKIPFVYRVHGNPDPDRVKNLINLVDAVGLNSLRLKKENPSPADFSSVLEQAKGTPSERIISHQILRTMDKARYSTEPTGHFGLSLEDYCHFTSPIRRYPDTAIHRILTAYIAGEKDLAKSFSSYADIAASQSSLCEVRAMTAERSAEDCYMAEFMRAHIGEEFDGIISGVTMRGVFVELKSSAEGFVPIDSFENGRFHFDGLVTQIDEATGRKLTIGQPLKILVAAADVATGRIDFVPVENLE